MRGRAKPRAATVALLLAVSGGMLLAPRGGVGGRAHTRGRAHRRTPRRSTSSTRSSSSSAWSVIGTVWAILLLLPVPLPRAPRAPGAQISGNTPLELGWTAAATVIVVCDHDHHLHLPRRHHATGGLGPRGRRRGARPVRDDQPAAASRRQVARHPGVRPAVPVALPVPQPGRVLPGDGGSARHDGDTRR